nr:hypothetical protein [Formosimonas limnophila]
MLSDTADFYIKLRIIILLHECSVRWGDSTLSLWHRDATGYSYNTAQMNAR